MRRSSSARAFVRHDLVTPDPSRAAEFLQGWLPWTFEKQGDRRTIHSPAGIVGLARLPDTREPVGPGWRCAAEVPDPERARDRAGRLGGRGLPPVAGAMSAATLLDPDGNAVEIGTADGEAGAAVPTTGSIVRHVLTTSRPEVVLPFYGEVMGWEIRLEARSGERRWTAFVRGTPVAEFERLRRDSDRPAGWVPYVLVDRLEASFRQAWEAGARLLSQPSDLPGPGRTALVQGPDGLLVGLFQWREV